jgi:LysR family transcriptional regulator, transcriptional activator of the cysJI operon
VKTSLTAFCRVANSNSFTKAAAELYLTQSAVSQHIRSLENHYGVRLFFRQKRGVILTPEGQILYDYAKKILSLYQEVENELLNRSGLTKGTLKICASSTVGEYILPAIVGSFNNKFPLVEISFSVGGNHYVLNGINRGDFDVGFMGEPYNAGPLVTEYFVTDEVCFIAAPTHPLSAYKSLTMEQLSTAKLILREHGTGTRSYIENIFRDSNISISDLKLWGECSSFESIKKLVHAGFGISAMSKWAITQDIYLGLLKILPVKSKKYTRNFVFVYRSEMLHSPLPALFISFCKDQRPDLSP